MKVVEIKKYGGPEVLEIGSREIPVLKENEVLIRIGAYQKGVDKELDEAVSKIEKMKKFLLQAPEEKFEFEQVVNLLKQTVN